MPNRHPDELSRELRALFREWEPDAIVVGVPYNMDGSASAMTAAAISFAERLGEDYQLPVDRVDERLTSAEAETMLREQRRTGQRRRQVRREDIDSLSARIIAESWLRNE